MRKLKLSMETKYESGFSLYTPHSGVTCTEVPISLSLSLSLALKLFFFWVLKMRNWGGIGGEARRTVSFFKRFSF